MAVVKHHSPGGTHSDQIKILMKNEWEYRKVHTLSLDELLKLWNSRGQATRTKKQLQNALSYLQREGIVVNTAGGGGRIGEYSLTSVLDKMTSPDTKEVHEVESSISVPVENTMEARDEWSEVSVIKGQIDKLIKSYDQFDETIQRLFGTAQSDIDKESEEHKQLFQAIGEVRQKVAGELSNFANYYDYTVGRLEAIETYLKDKSEASPSSNEMEGYKQGFKDGWSMRNEMGN